MVETLINLITIALLVVYLAYIWNNSKKEGAIVYYAVMHFFTMFAIILFFIIEFSNNSLVRLILKEIMFFTSQCFYVSFFYFGRFMYRKKPESKMVNIFFGVYLSINLIITLSDPLNTVFVETSTGLDYHPGILFYVLMTTGLVIGESGVVFNALDVKNFDIVAIMSYLTLGLAFIISILYYLKMCEFAQIHICVISILVLFTFTALLVGFYMMGFFYSASRAIIQSLEMFSQAIVAFDKYGEVQYKNLACKVYDEKCFDLISNEFKKILKINNFHLSKSLKAEIEMVDPRITVTLSIRPFKNKFKRILYYIGTINDDTDINLAIRNLKEKNEYLIEMNNSVKMLSEETKKLAVMEERNLLAKEIHDILGHSMILALSILESNRYLISGNPEKAATRLQQAVEEINLGFKEINDINSNKTEFENSGINRMLDRLELLAEKLSDANIKLELSITDDLKECGENTFNTIYRICQEAVTNAIKHGQANYILVSIKKTDDVILLHIVDNGRGCFSYKKGNGLLGMEDRVGKIGGNIIFRGFEDQTGFLVQATIPAA